MEEQLQNSPFTTTVILYQSNYVYVYKFHSESEKLSKELLLKLESNYGIPTSVKNDSGTILGELVEFTSTYNKWYNIHKYVFKIDLFVNSIIQKIKNLIIRFINY